MTTLGFGATATIGALRYTAGLAAVRVAFAIGPGVGSARITMPRDLRVDAKPGDAVSIALRGEGGEDTDVFAGTVLTVRRALDRTVVLCGDAAAALAAVRPGSTFEHQSASAVIDAFAREAGVDTGTIDLDLDLASYIADQGRTAWEHTSTLAAWGGALATTTADGAVEVRPFPSPPAGVALRYGREIAELGVTTPAPGPTDVWTGNGPAGDASDPRAQLQTTSTLPEDAPGPDAHTLRIAAPALRTPAAAASAIQASSARNGGARLTATCWLVPGLRAGTAVEIADAPTPDSTGPWLLTRVVHTVGPGPAGRTSFEAVSMRSAGPGLLGQLIGAVGSLL